MMKSALLIELRYKEVMEEIKKLRPGFSEAANIDDYLAIQTSIILVESYLPDSRRRSKAVSNLGYAMELKELFTTRKN